MELVSRMMDGSIPYDPKEAGPEEPFGPPLRRDHKVERLQKVPILEGCSRRQLRAVAKISHVYDAKPGTILTRTGDAGDDFFLIVDGTARVDVAPDKHLRLTRGDFFGEMSLLDGLPRSATVVAETAMRLLVINRRHFWELLGELPALTHNILVRLSQRLRHAENSPRS